MDFLKNTPKGEQLFQAIIGTYEEFIVGYSLYFDEDTKKHKFYQKFSNHAHSGSVKSINCSAKGILVSGGTDEVCNLINLKKNKELGNLIEQEGAITSIHFHDSKHLFTASEDNTICIWDSKSWECLKKLKGHKKAVTSISIHNSGKIMLSISKDKTIRTWNLIQGRCSFVTNLKEAANFIYWSPNDKQFLVVYDKRIDIYNIENCGVEHSISFSNGVNCVKFLTESIILIGAENENIEVYDISKKKTIYIFKAHERRVKDIAIISAQLITDWKYLFCTISSDGFLKLWALNLETETTHELLAEVNTKCRPNCLTIYENKTLDQNSNKNNLNIIVNEEIKVDETEETHKKIQIIHENQLKPKKNKKNKKFSNLKNNEISNGKFKKQKVK